MARRENESRPSLEVVDASRHYVRTRSAEALKGLGKDLGIGVLKVAVGAVALGLALTAIPAAAMAAGAGAGIILVATVAGALEVAGVAISAPVFGPVVIGAAIVGAGAGTMLLAEDYKEAVYGVASFFGDGLDRLLLSPVRRVGDIVRANSTARAARRENKILNG